MGTGGYKIRHKEAIHFITFAVVEWIDVFTRNIYKDIVLDSIRYCQKEKGFNLHAWCLMTNHIHMVASARNANLSDILRDFKKFTSRQLVKAIEDNPTESRKEWMLRVFHEQGAKNIRNRDNQFWRQANHPKECFGNAFTFQKIDYIHRNPVKAGIVDRAEAYLYSSARDYYYEENCELLEVVRI